MKLIQYGKAVAIAASLSLFASYANADDLASMVGTVAVDGAKSGLLAIGAALGGFLALGIGIRYVLGFMKRI